MPERLVITAVGNTRYYTSRARISNSGYLTPRQVDFDEQTTELGRKLMSALGVLDGIDITYMKQHQIVVRLVHAELWTWDEVEPGIIAAFADILGGEPETIRETA